MWYLMRTFLKFFKTRFASFFIGEEYFWGMEGYSFGLHRTTDGPHVMNLEMRNIITDLVLNIFMFEDYCLLVCDAMWAGRYVLKFQRNLLSQASGQINLTWMSVYELHYISLYLLLASRHTLKHLKFGVVSPHRTLCMYMHITGINKHPNLIHDAYKVFHHVLEVC
jgi:hypothetical protein